MLRSNIGSHAFGDGLVLQVDAADAGVLLTAALLLAVDLVVIRSVSGQPEAAKPIGAVGVLLGTGQQSPALAPRRAGSSGCL